MPSAALHQISLTHTSRGPETILGCNNAVTSPKLLRLVLLVTLLLVLPRTADAGMNSGISIAKYRREYDDDDDGNVNKDTPVRKLQHGKGGDFRFGRFQSLSAVKKALNGCRSPKSFKLHHGKDGRKGMVCSTKLGGDWVLAESEQLAPSCTCEQVLIAYLDGRLQKIWSADKVIDVKTELHKHPKTLDDCDNEPYYKQDLILHSQRVIRSRTGVMRYSQRITVDKIGAGNYVAFVQLDPDEASTTVKKPFNSLSVYVGLQQQGKDVKVYAAGVFEVNRKVVPNLLIFDASGIAGNMAGKGTLWLAGHFEEIKSVSPVAHSAGAKRIKRDFVDGVRNRFNSRQRSSQLEE